MAEQDGWKPHEAQAEPLLPISSGLGTHYRGLQKFVGPFGPVSPKKEVEAVVVPF